MHVAVRAGPDGGGRGADMHGQTKLLDVPAQHRTAGVVDLDGHEPRRELDHVGGQTQQP